MRGVNAIVCWDRLAETTAEYVKKDDPLYVEGRLQYRSYCGALPEEDVRENEWSLENGARLFSAYQTQTDEKLWVITEWDRRCAASPVVGSLPQAARSGGTI
jgi:hypothetical protein